MDTLIVIPNDRCAVPIPGRQPWLASLHSRLLAAAASCTPRPRPQCPAGCWMWWGRGRPCRTPSCWPTTCCARHAHHSTARTARSAGQSVPFTRLWHQAGCLAWVQLRLPGARCWPSGLTAGVCARAGRAGHLRHHHHPRPGQRGLCGREGHHVQLGHGHAGRRRVHRQESRRGGRHGAPPPACPPAAPVSRALACSLCDTRLPMACATMAEGPP